MPIKQIFEYSCDLCPSTETEEDLPKGWVMLRVKNKIADTEKKLVCCKCKESIQNLCTFDSTSASTERGEPANL